MAKWEGLGWMDGLFNRNRGYLRAWLEIGHRRKGKGVVWGKEKNWLCIPAGAFFWKIYLFVTMCFG